jgi:hypothetical protein
MELELNDYLNNFGLGLDEIYSQISKSNDFDYTDTQLKKLILKLQKSISDRIALEPENFADKVDIGLFSKQSLSSDANPQFNLKISSEYEVSEPTDELDTKESNEMYDFKELVDILKSLKYYSTNYDYSEIRKKGNIESIFENRQIDNLLKGETINAIVSEFNKSYESEKNIQKSNDQFSNYENIVLFKNELNKENDSNKTEYSNSEFSNYENSKILNSLITEITKSKDYDNIRKSFIDSKNYKTTNSLTNQSEYSNSLLTNDLNYKSLSLTNENLYKVIESNKLNDILTKELIKTTNIKSNDSEFIDGQSYKLFSQLTDGSFKNIEFQDKLNSEIVDDKIYSFLKNYSFVNSIINSVNEKTSAEEIADSVLSNYGTDTISTLESKKFTNSEFFNDIQNYNANKSNIEYFDSSKIKSSNLYENFNEMNNSIVNLFKYLTDNSTNSKNTPSSEENDKIKKIFTENILDSQVISSDILNYKFGKNIEDILVTKDSIFKNGDYQNNISESNIVKNSIDINDDTFLRIPNLSTKQIFGDSKVIDNRYEKNSDASTNLLNTNFINSIQLEKISDLIETNNEKKINSSESKNSPLNYDLSQIIKNYTTSNNNEILTIEDIQNFKDQNIPMKYFEIQNIFDKDNNNFLTNNDRGEFENLIGGDFINDFFTIYKNINDSNPNSEMNFMDRRISIQDGLTIPNISNSYDTLQDQVYNISNNQLIPEFAEGTKGIKFTGGPAIVGERGVEKIITESGKVYLTPNTATLMDLPRGSQVIPNNQLNQRDIISSELQRTRVNNIQMNPLNINSVTNPTLMNFNQELNTNNLVSNISNFVDGFVNNIQKINESFESLNKQVEFTQLRSPINEKNTTNDINNLDLDLNFNKLNSINNNMVNKMVMSMDPEQFKLLVESNESNSNLTLDKTVEPKKVNEQQIINLKTNKDQVSNENPNDDLIDVMSSLDQKMSMMVQLLRNMQNWFNDNQKSPSLRPYKQS